MHCIAMEIQNIEGNDIKCLASYVCLCVCLIHLHLRACNPIVRRIVEIMFNDHATLQRWSEKSRISCRHGTKEFITQSMAYEKYLFVRAATSLI